MVGERYDATVHEKAGELQLEAGAEGGPAAGTITEEVSSGLKMKVGVVRRAKVVVAMAAPEPEKPKEEEEPKGGEEAASEEEAAAEGAAEEEAAAPEEEAA